ncbi:MAG: cation:dicarboxylase symporter family transporter [Oleispira antarctica]|uniref:Sodium:dicarboxylate symporter family protein n=1 Tax=Oleispira antarctica RB-8 TaxID=698738 RepID=R4YRX3_OLEAN|nr:cation:dicarboxylase symporter family transporter [Oleispira antarctica]MBQ0792291.1 cation:dicarboxylase symporter family transporter [Oleispira antarctica]CCK77852.1 Sodium:dicarboxylate symporter family protein [Oleispira antarctica RB-8]
MLFKKIPSFIRILLAMVAGLAIGAYTSTVFMGVDAIANAFVMLLQMTALPYISLSLIVGIGGLSATGLSSTFKQSLLILFLLISTVLFFILLAPIAFPDWTTAEFYSVETIKVSTEFDLVDLFIPANPFNAFANALIPSIVTFSIFIGIGLMSVHRKKHALLLLGNLQTAVANVSVMVMRFAPVGIFCIGLRAAATVNPSDLDGLLVYVVTSAVLVLLLAFIVLPTMVAIITPFGYRQIMKASREAMVTAFATGSFFIVLPVIVEKTKVLIAQLHSTNKDIDKVPSIIVPITFSLPVGGKLLALLFTLFAAWFSGAYISLSDYVTLIVVGVPQLFGTSIIAVPNLLELFNVSGSMFDFFLVAENLIVGRIAALLSVIFAVCLPLLVATSMVKGFTFKWQQFARNALIIPVVCIAAFVAVKHTFQSISYQYEGYSKFINRDFLYESIPTTYLEKPSASSANVQPFKSVLDRVKQRGFLRVGYFRDDLPYSFHNSKGKLVGFDIEIMNQLAGDLGVGIEFVKIFRKEAGPLLASGYLDITSGVPVIPDNMKEFLLSWPYSDQHVAFIVKDKRRAEFVDWENIRDRKDLIIGIPEKVFYKKAVKAYFTKGKAWEISTPRLFFKEEFKHIDAMLLGAPAASAWTLLNPSYTVVSPKPLLPALTMAFPINKNDQLFELYLRNWIKMKKRNKSLDRLFSYWIEGEKPAL